MKTRGEHKLIFYYIRHGEPIYDPDSLTAYGAEQAKALAKRFALYGLDEIYSSPSGRALQTAKETCTILNKKPVVLDWTHESLVWTEFTVERNGRRTWLFYDKEYREKFCSKAIISLGEDWIDSTIISSEKTKQGKMRVDKEVDEYFLGLGLKHNREKGGYEVLQPNKNRIALFAHQGFGMVFLSSLLDIPYPIFCSRFDLGHSGVTVIYFNEKEEITYPKILQLSNDSHLYKEDILNGYQGWIDI